MDKIISNYKLKLLDKNLSLSTVESYLHDIHSFEEYMVHEYNSSTLEVKRAQVLTYLVKMQKDGKSSATIARTISALKNFYEYLKNERLIKDNPAISIHSPKQIKKEPCILSEDDVNQLMKLPNTKTFKGCRDSAILELLYSSGIKVSELININISDVNFSASLICINGKNERIVPMGDIANKAVYEYMNKFRPIKCRCDETILFLNSSGEAITRQGIWKILKYYEDKLQLGKEVSPQVLRNSFAVHLLNNGADIVTVQELLGHRSLSATQNYMQSVELKSLDVFKKAHPRA